VRFVSLVSCLVASTSAVACESTILIGADRPPPADAGAPDATVEAATGFDANAETQAVNAGADSGEAGGLQPLAFPWSTGFENGFADWQQPPNQGFCYAVGAASMTIVSSPVHSGNHAAAFMVDTSPDAAESQTRCVRQGVLPQSAYYGAWYYVPSAPVNTGNWNLLHFQGANVPDGMFAHGLWDVSLANPPGSTPRAYAYDFLRANIPDASAAPPIPIGSWFHLEAFLRRATDGTGQFTIYQDGRPITGRSGVPTDDSLWGQWFVGNLATALTPPISTVYVDDVTIGASL
jgi:hypothetical protein